MLVCETRKCVTLSPSTAAGRKGDASSRAAFGEEEREAQRGCLVRVRAPSRTKMRSQAAQGLLGGRSERLEGPHGVACLVPGLGSRGRGMSGMGACPGSPRWQGWAGTSATNGGAFVESQHCPLLWFGRTNFAKQRALGSCVLVLWGKKPGDTEQAPATARQLGRRVTLGTRGLASWLMVCLQLFAIF